VFAFFTFFYPLLEPPAPCQYCNILKAFGSVLAHVGSTGVGEFGVLLDAPIYAVEKMFHAFISEIEPSALVESLHETVPACLLAVGAAANDEAEFEAWVVL
jgi:hypothetical protein